jgi:hypothetical protein
VASAPIQRAKKARAQKSAKATNPQLTFAKAYVPRAINVPIQRAKTARAQKNVKATSPQLTFAKANAPLVISAKTKTVKTVLVPKSAKDTAVGSFQTATTSQVAVINFYFYYVVIT